MTVTREDLVKTLGLDAKDAKTDRAVYGEVMSINEDQTYQVSLNGSDTTVKCARLSGAKVGDTVLVEILANGYSVVTGTVGGDTDASAAQSSADAAASAAQTADDKAVAAGRAADAADSKADAASAAATRAEGKADAASAAASRAETAAGNAETSAANAQSSADSALVGLSTVQDVVGVLNWITAHGTMTSQSGGTFDENQVYFIQDNNGDYTVGGVKYSLVAEPKAADINSYYVLTVDESVQNYVATHIVVDSEGLWIIPDAGGNKVLIATGNGSTYTTAGTYIIGEVNNVDKVLAKFLATGATVGQIDGAHSVIDGDGQRFYASDGTTQLANIGYGEGASGSGTAVAPYYTFGKRTSGSVVGNFSVAEGSSVTASGEKSHAEGSSTSATAQAAHAEGIGTTASGINSHAEGYYSVAGAGDAHAEGDHTTASAIGAHAEGGQTVASGQLSHAQNNSTIAAKDNQTAIGKYNLEDTETTTAKQKAFIIGNGTSNTARSNAFDVDWSGNTEVAGDITDGSGNVLSALATALAGKIDGSAGSSGSTGITLGRWKICWGTVSMNTNSASGSGTFTAPYYVDQNITLNFDAVPYVWAQCQGSLTGTNYVLVTSTSKTSATLRLMSSHKNTNTRNVRWFAIGQA